MCVDELKFFNFMEKLKIFYLIDLLFNRFII